MANPVPPFRIIIPCVQVYLFLLAVCCFLLGMDYADTSFLNGFIMPMTVFAFWGAVQGWAFVQVLKMSFTISHAHYSAVLWTLPAFFTPLIPAIYYLTQPLDPFIILPVILIALGYTLLLCVWYGVAYLFFRRYYERNPWAAY